MKKHLLLAVAAAVLALPLLRPAAAEPSQSQAQAQKFEADRATIVDARIAAIKAGLRLAPAQEKDWDNLETVAREVIAARAARQQEAMKEAAAFHDKDDVIDGMKLASKELIARGEEVQKVAEAAAPLYASMDAAQKHRFAMLLHSFAPSAQH
ncbi:Spy/CpxP family protein refolding chaperone [Rhodoblastus acidophilus]|uniref:Spy/CpxP family protein refolding chaperone n=1 Tax=Candidatus Rhodoblastus alkanivorans TaxID=2954117 RepID=A0ABS9Z9C6_9HYPH|nr:Spy/CpxP family protein refolding chaperone [Candidatus Rhodoblastus alkanivorans]MCI4678900.1 Spy/CpxP family protein refolding chaperone [Candidatus Rhodoblastus alkanivorans]MCI4684176.1 Spy/CpxP family protein refolding chaperone [Candidatus Rhodoblastus alkanivorans]MDI4641497.1 Spy/CpxP family protein refolding chaperone [Rhodoblastus acidophilus]